MNEDSVSQGWIVLENDSDEPLCVFIEPCALDCEIPPKSSFDVYLPRQQPANIEGPKITYTAHKMIILWAWFFAIFHNGKEILDFSEIEGLRPPDPAEPFAPDMVEEGE